MPAYIFQILIVNIATNFVCLELVGGNLFGAIFWCSSQTMGSCTEFAWYLTLKEAGSRSFSCYEQRMSYICAERKTMAWNNAETTAWNIPNEQNSLNTCMKQSKE